MVNLKSSVGRVRAVGVLGGFSFLLVMGIAMPLKYMGGMPVAVRFTGVHHLLFGDFYGVE